VFIVSSFQFSVSSFLERANEALEHGGDFFGFGDHGSEFEHLK
jgi:hypothetical protein